MPVWMQKSVGKKERLKADTMAQEETVGLDILIKQRKTRQKYVRMISWGRPDDEVTHADPGESEAKGSRHDREPEEDEVSTGSDEFYSAEEGSDLEDYYEEKIEASEEEYFVFSERKKQSKMKRKRRRQLLRSLESETESEEVECETFNILDFFSPSYKNLPPEEIPNLAVGVGAVEVRREVPSLVELCLECYQTLSSRFGQNLPPGIKRLLTMFRYESSMRTVQIEWLNRGLAFVERYFALPKDSRSKGGIESEQIFCIRNLRESGREYMSNTDVLKNTLIFPLIWPSLVDESRRSQFYGRQQTENNLPCSERWHESFGVEVMANIIDLMLPVTIGTKVRLKKNEVCEDYQAKQLELALRKIRHTISKKFPKYTDYMFGLAQGYALWVRGDLENAEKAFCQNYLSKTHTYGYSKSLIRNELGRMYAMFGDLVNASQYFLAAAEDEQEDEEVENPVKDATNQALVLIASQTDTGVLTTAKAQESHAAWNALIKRREFDYIPGIIPMAAESTLRNYGGHIVDSTQTSWHLDILNRLEYYGRKTVEAKFALSLIHAMHGDVVPAKEEYTQFLCSITTPGMDYRENSLWSFPFTPILDQMADRVQPIKPIRLLWRTQLCYPCFTYNQSEADYHSKPTDDCSLSLNLHLSDEGYLTGDMAMQVPPLRGVYLDPYTGGLCLPHVPVKTTAWKDLSVHQSIHKESSCPRETFRIPRILRVLDDETCVVDLCIAANPDFHSQSATLTWIGTDGGRVTLDLRKLIRAEQKKRMISQLSEAKEKKGEEWFSRRVDMIKHFIQQGWVLDQSRLNEYVNYKDILDSWKKDEKERRQMKHERKSPKGKHTKPKAPRPPPFMLFLANFYTYKQTVILQLMADQPYWSDLGVNVVVVVNCASVETFRNVKVHCDGDKKYVFDQVPSVITSPLKPAKGHTQIHHFPHAEVFIIRGTVHHGSLSVFDTDGNITEYPSRKEDGKLQVAEKGPYYIVGTNFYHMREEGKEKSTLLVKESVDHTRPEKRSIAGIKAVHQVEDLFIINMDLGICLLNPLTMELFKLKNHAEKLSFSLESDETIIMGEDLDVTTLASRRKRSGVKHCGQVVQITVGVKGHVLILELAFDGKSCQYTDEIHLIQQIDVPGIPREICYVSYEAGLLIATSFNQLDDDFYRNHMYQFSHDGKMVGILPFLGRGPHRFTPIYLEDSDDYKHLDDDIGNAGWYVYFVDGHGALACFNTSATSAS